MNPQAPTVQEKCDQLVRQFYDEFAELRRDVSSAVKAVAQVWELHFPDPTEMHGMLYCTSVRGMLLLNRVGDVRNVDEEPPAGVLHTRYGQGLSVVIRDGRGMYCRVRKAPAEFFSERRERLVVRLPRTDANGIQTDSAADAAAASAGQETLSPEMAALPRSPARKYEWFVLWTLSPDGLQVPDVYLAAVVDIDSPSKVVILASSPLPRKARPQVVVDDSDDDFGDYGPTTEESTGSAPA